MVYPPPSPCVWQRIRGERRGSLETTVLPESLSWFWGRREGKKKRLFLLKRLFKKNRKPRWLEVAVMSVLAFFFWSDDKAKRQQQLLLHRLNLEFPLLKLTHQAHTLQGGAVYQIDLFFIVFITFFFFKSTLLSLVALFLKSKLREATQNGWELTRSCWNCTFLQSSFSFSLSPPFCRLDLKGEIAFMSERKQRREGKGGGRALH